MSGCFVVYAAGRASGQQLTTDDDFAGWLFQTTGDRLLYREGTSLPGFPEEAQLFFSNSRLNANGDVAVFGRFRAGFGEVTTANDRGVWIDMGAGLQLVVRSGDPALGAPAGAAHEGFGIHAFNHNTVVATSGTLRVGMGGVTTNDNSVIYTNRSGPLSLAYREGEIATGSAVFDTFDTVRLNNENLLAFEATLKTGIGGVNSFNGDGIWVETGSGLRLVARTDQIMPGTTSSKFRSFQNLVINDQGRVAFTASSGSPTTFNTIFSEGIDGQLALVARASTAAPGTDPGVNFDFDHIDFIGIPKLMINNRGQVAFFAGLSGTGVTTANDLGLWAQDTNGLLRLIVREGNPIEVAPGDLRTVETFHFGNMNQLGQIVFDALFTDGTSGVFVSNLVAQLPGDFDNDGDVDGRDFLLWQRQYTGTNTLVANFAVPEPSGMILFCSLTAFALGCGTRNSLARAVLRQLYREYAPSPYIEGD